MSRLIFFWAATVLAGFILQVTLADRIAVFGIFPNLLLLGTIFYALRRGPLLGEWVGFVWGLLSDVASISLFGSQTFMLTLIGYAVGHLEGKIDEEKVFAQMVLVCVTSVAYFLGLFLLETLFGGSAQRFRIAASLLQAAYSTLISPLAFWLLFLWSHRLKRPEFRLRRV